MVGGLRQTNNYGLPLQRTQTQLMSRTITSVSASLTMCCQHIYQCVYTYYAHIYLYIRLMLTQPCSPATSDNDTAESLRFHDEKLVAAKRAMPQARVQVCTTQHISKSLSTPHPLLSWFHGTAISQTMRQSWWGGLAPALQSFPVNMLINELLALFHM